MRRLVVGDERGQGLRQLLRIIGAYRGVMYSLLLISAIITSNAILFTGCIAHFGGFGQPGQFFWRGHRRKDSSFQIKIGRGGS